MPSRPVAPLTRRENTSFPEAWTPAAARYASRVATLVFGSGAATTVPPGSVPGEAQADSAASSPSPLVAVRIVRKALLCCHLSADCCTVVSPPGMLKRGPMVAWRSKQTPEEQLTDPLYLSPMWQNGALGETKRTSRRLKVKFLKARITGECQQQGG